MPIYTRPKTWKTPDAGESIVLGHFELNTYIRDNALVCFNAPAVRAHRGSEALLNSGQWQTLDTPFSRFDVTNIHTRGQSDRLVIVDPGYYLVGGTIRFKNRSVSGDRILRLIVNDDFIIGQTGPHPGFTAEHNRFTVYGFHYFRGGDFVKFQSFQDSGVDLTIKGEPPTSPEWWAVRLGDRQKPPAWTAPRDWSSGDQVTAALLNAHARDNFEHLRRRKIAHLWHSLEGSGNNLHNSSGNWLAAIFDSEFSDTEAMHSVSSDTSKLTPGEAGVYLVGGSLEFEVGASASDGHRAARLRKNDTTSLAECNGVPADDDGPQRVQVITLESASATDYYEIEGWQNSGGNRQVQSTFALSPSLWAVQVAVAETQTSWTDPKTWTAREAATALHTDLNTYLRDNQRFLRYPPHVRLSKATQQHSSSGNWQEVTFNNRDFGYSGMHNTTDGRLQFAVGGKYLIGAHLDWDTNGTGRRGVRIRRVTTGAATTTIVEHNPQQISGSLKAAANCVGLFEFAANDYLIVNTWQNSGANLGQNNIKVWALWVAG